MRGFGLMAVLTVLAGCGDQSAREAPEANAADGNQGLNVADNSNHATKLEPTEQGNSAAPIAGAAGAAPCMTQGADRLEIRPFRANGTEPFWSARVEGRCVTYSTPEDQQGVRVWTRYTRGPDESETWVGQLDGTRFELRTRAKPGCSDGMSDKSYPMAAELTVRGEQRRGCAETL